MSTENTSGILIQRLFKRFVRRNHTCSTQIRPIVRRHLSDFRGYGIVFYVKQLIHYGLHFIQHFLVFHNLLSAQKCRVFTGKVKVKVVPRPSLLHKIGSYHPNLSNMLYRYLAQDLCTYCLHDQSCHVCETLENLCSSSVGNAHTFVAHRLHLRLRHSCYTAVYFKTRSFRGLWTRNVV